MNDGQAKRAERESRTSSPANGYRSNEGHLYRPYKHSPSVMREFLESGDEFTWPPDLGECSGNHCDFKLDINGIPLSWKRKITDGKATIDVYEAEHLPYKYDFKKPFVVKTIRNAQRKLAREEASNEVELMRDLRHPHVTALLGTYTFQERLSILIFPAACCDLSQFMKQMCRDMRKVHSQSPHLEILDVNATPTDSSIATNSTTSVSNKSHGQDSDDSEKRDNTWPMNAPFQSKILILRRCFVCLSEALSYLHASDVRHKDIKPENILIDQSGSLILTDFGISRRFPKNTPHSTNDQWKFTRKYASPEMMKGKTVPRDDPSDVFSLGCVFLEVATLLLGEDLKRFSKHYTSTVNNTGVEEAYHCNLPRLYSWIEFLRARGPNNSQDQPLLAENIMVQNHIPDADQVMVDSLIPIRQMLDENPQARPKSQGLWKCFQYISPEKCIDCDPRLAERWKPSLKQQQNAITGLQNRRSMISEDAVSLESWHIARTGEIDSRLLSAQEQPIRSPRELSSANTSTCEVHRHQYPETTSRPSPSKYRSQDNGAGSQRFSRSPSSTINIIPKGPQDVNPFLDHQPTPAQDITPNISSVVEAKSLVSLSRSTSSSAAQGLAVQQPLIPPMRDSLPRVQSLGASRSSQDGKAPKNTQIIVYDVERRRLYQTNSDLILGALLPQHLLSSLLVHH